MIWGFKTVFGKLRYLFKLGNLRHKWHKKNKHNFTVPNNLFDVNCVKVGIGTYGPLNVYTFGTNNKLSIGNYCSISKGVSFLLAGGHNLNTFTTYPFKDMILKRGIETLSKGNIVVEDDCWIGFNSVILSGVRIGKGSVVGACSLVTKDVPPYSVVGGVPAKIIKKRNKDEIIEMMKEVDFETLDVEKNIDILYKDLDTISAQKTREYVEMLNMQK